MSRPANWSSMSRAERREWNRAVFRAERGGRAITTSAERRHEQRMRSGTAGRSRSGLAGNLTGGSAASQLVYLLGDVIRMEREASRIGRDFYEELPDDPAGRRLLKSVWGVAKSMGITTRNALDQFKALHHRAIESASR